MEPPAPQEPRLKLFRRHESSCKRHYPREQRIYEHETVKIKGRESAALADCACPISAEGTLTKADGFKHYLRPKSTGKRTWKEAKKIALQWEQWGDLQPPVPYQYPTAVLVRVADAAEQYLEIKKQKLGELSIQQRTQWVRQRLVPFARTQGVEYIQQANQAKFWGDFYGSWKNLGRGRAGEELAPNSRCSLLDITRNFIKFGLGRDWFSKAWASSDYEITRNAQIEPKEPFTDGELDYIYRAARQRNGESWRTQVFLWVMRYTGLRISDVLRLECAQLVAFDHAGYSHAIYCYPQKTKRTRKQGNFVHIPIPNAQFGKHPDLAKALQEIQASGQRYFFRQAAVEFATDLYHWRTRIVAVMEKAEKMMQAEGKSFSAHPHPHRMRHTFAAKLLQSGVVSLRIIAQYLGDTETVVRKHYAKFCGEEQKMAAMQMAAAMG